MFLDILWEMWYNVLTIEEVSMAKTFKDKLTFNYDGVDSIEFGIYSVSLDSGMFDEHLVADRSINESEVGKGRRVLNRIDEEPIEFELTLAFMDGFDESLLDDVIDWLFQDYYKPFYFEGGEDRIYHCVAEGSSTLVHTGFREGYFTINMRCNSSRAYSRTKTTDRVTATGFTPAELTIENAGDEMVTAQYSIRANSDTIILIEMDKNVQIRNIKSGEDIFIDSHREIIETNKPNVYHYDDVDGDLRYLNLKRGVNNIKVTGDCSFQIRYKEEYRK